MVRTMRVAVGQMDVKLGDKEANIAKAEEFVSRGVEEKAELICLPELFTTGFAKENLAELAEEIPGKTTKKLANLAAKNSIHIAGSILEKSGEKIYNAGVLVSPEGIVGKHRKTHLFLEEAARLAAGTEYVTTDTRLGKIGLLVCYDAIFPEAVRAVSLHDCDVVLLPANWMNPFLDQWRLATSARALDNQVWLVAANRVGSDETYTYFGRSRIVNPYGQTVLECGEGEEVGVAEVDFGKSTEFRKIVNFLADRKPKTYGRVAEG